MLFSSWNLLLPWKFCAGRGIGNSGNAKVTLEKTIMLSRGNNTIDLLSATVGLQVVLIPD